MRTREGINPTKPFCLIDTAKFGKENLYRTAGLTFPIALRIPRKRGNGKQIMLLAF